MIELDNKESIMMADMLRFALEHCTNDFTEDLEMYDEEIKLYRKLIKSHN